MLTADPRGWVVNKQTVTTNKHSHPLTCLTRLVTRLPLAWLLLLSSKLCVKLCSLRSSLNESVPWRTKCSLKINAKNNKGVMTIFVCTHYYLSVYKIFLGILTNHLLVISSFHIIIKFNTFFRFNWKSKFFYGT